MVGIGERVMRPCSSAALRFSLDEHLLSCCRFSLDEHFISCEFSLEEQRGRIVGIVERMARPRPSTTLLLESSASGQTAAARNLALAICKPGESGRGH